MPVSPRISGQTRPIAASPIRHLYAQARRPSLRSGVHSCCRRRPERQARPRPSILEARVAPACSTEPISMGPGTQWRPRRDPRARGQAARARKRIAGPDLVTARARSPIGFRSANRKLRERARAHGVTRHNQPAAVCKPALSRARPGEGRPRARRAVESLFPGRAARTPADLSARGGHGRVC